MNLDNKNKDQDTESLEGREDKKRLYSINASDGIISLIKPKVTDIDVKIKYQTGMMYDQQAAFCFI